MMRRLVPSSASSNPHSGIEAALDARWIPLLLRFTYLQLLDALTTLVFLTSGVKEANPVVRFAMGAAHSPLAGLLALKLAAFGVAIFCCVTARTRVLSRMNIFFGALVVWNLIALLAS